MRARCLIPLAAGVILWTAAPALAQVVVTPYGHLNFGDVEFRRGGAGLAAGYFGRWIGFELDADFHSHFFKDKDLQSIPHPCLPGVVGPCTDDNTNAWVFSADAVVPIPTPRTTRWHPYASAGVGMIHSWIQDAGPYDAKQTNLAFNASVGVLYWFTAWFAVRADARYFHVFVDENNTDGGYSHDYDFGRVSIGVTFAPFSMIRR